VGRCCRRESALEYVSAVGRVEISETNLLQFYIPPGFAHGFCVLSDRADFDTNARSSITRKTRSTALERPGIEYSLAVENPIVSARDAANRSLRSALAVE